ncbi:hypothetical protein MED121_04138 [Marinomonas sp. MED121]|uniref:cupin domain-containing protein n=1 Tax=Marinomonas sp. MED121 TaxID=314277 RepID=UPI000068FAD0|nr:cupin domain-containing protein [Marinomonas sp. MED121]EAQ63931.1 hypothetical protein MED121_04138 [Marinomonas sp. MED121]
MKKVSLEKVQPYNPPAHFDMTALKLQGKEETGITQFWQGLSYFLPKGGADMQYEKGSFGAEFEKTYFIIKGELTITNAEGDSLVLCEGDSIAIYPNEGRSVFNHTNNTTSALVTVSTG